MRQQRAAFLALSLVAAAPLHAAEDADETQFVSRNRCVVAQIVNLIRAAPFDPKNTAKDRFLILTPSDREDQYAQCHFFDRDASVHCEVASPFYAPTAQARLAPLARLGYDLDGAKSNYTKEFLVDAEGSPPLADFMLQSLFGAFLDDPKTRIRFIAPLVKASPSAKACTPLS